MDEEENGGRVGGGRSHTEEALAYKVKNIYYLTLDKKS